MLFSHLVQFCLTQKPPNIQLQKKTGLSHCQMNDMFAKFDWIFVIYRTYDCAIKPLNKAQDHDSDSVRSRRSSGSPYVYHSPPVITRIDRQHRVSFFIYYILIISKCVTFPSPCTPPSLSITVSLYNIQEEDHCSSLVHMENTFNSYWCCWWRSAFQGGSKNMHRVCVHPQSHEHRRERNEPVCVVSDWRIRAYFSW